MGNLDHIAREIGSEIKRIQDDLSSKIQVVEERTIQVEEQTNNLESIGTDLSEHENKLRAHEAKIEFNVYESTKIKDDLKVISSDFDVRISTIEAQILTIQNDLEKFGNISNSLNTYFSSLLESDPQNTNLAQLVASLSENLA
jgi:predicted  nucleic acid-binding Zn-ribbon protein